MKEKYFAIDPSYARQLIARATKTEWSKRGVDRRAYLIDDCAVLATDRLKLRNVTTRDDDLRYFDEIAETLLKLFQQNVATVPVLGYCYDINSADGTGFIIQKRADGSELLDDAILSEFQVWTRQDNSYFGVNMSKTEKIRYLLSRIQEISLIPQEHFDKFVNDMICILKHDILIDCFGKSNFFYDEDRGFQFIDLDSHNDYKYGLTSQKPDIEKAVSVCAYAPCLYAEGTQLFAPNAMSSSELFAFTSEQQNSLAECNSVIFQKCTAALRQNGISQSVLNKTLSMLKIYGDDRI